MNHQKKHSVLFIAADPPIPFTGGGSRTFHLLKGVAEISDCTAVVLFPVAKNNLPGTLTNLCRAIYCAITPFSHGVISKWKYFFSHLQLLIYPRSAGIKKLISSADYYANHFYEGKSKWKGVFYRLLRRRLILTGLKLYQDPTMLPARTLERYAQYAEMEALIKAQLVQADMVWIDFSFLLPFFRALKAEHPSVKKVCNAHNIEYSYLGRLAELAHDPLQKQWLQCQAKAMKRAELQGFADCDMVITCSAADQQQVLTAMPRARVEVIPNGVDLAYFKPAPVEPTRPVLLFTGTMTYTPNRDAVHYFLKEIFPLVKKEIPDCCLVVAGLHAAAVFTEYKDRQDMELVDSPADMRPVYNRASVVVVPLRSGSGTRLKILEAMAMGKPVVSTSIGAEGIKVIDRVHLRICDTAIDFNNAITELLHNRSLYNAIVSKGSEIISNNYSWEIIIANLKQHLIDS